MSSLEGHRPSNAKTRLPFRLAAVLLGGLFIAFGLYQLLGGAENWFAFAGAIVIALMGVRFLQSAFVDQWSPLFAWVGRSEGGRMPASLLVVEPVPRGITQLESGVQADAPRQSINPYAPPMASPSPPLEPPPDGAALRDLTQSFLDGHPFIHYGVVYFLDPDDDAVIHAALPLSSPSDALVGRNTKEAIRVLPDFLGSLPDVIGAVTGKTLVVRMIASYDRFDDEVANRTVVSWADIFSG